MPLPALISREILFGNPERLSPQLSPDGRWLAYIAPDNKNVLQIWVGDASKGNAQILTADPKRGIRSFFWTYQPDLLIYLQDLDGDENFHLHAVNIRTKDVRDLTPFAGGVRAEVLALEPNLPGEILVAMNQKRSAASMTCTIACSYPPASSYTLWTLKIPATSSAGRPMRTCKFSRRAFAARPDGGA